MATMCIGIQIAFVLRAYPCRNDFLNFNSLISTTEQLPMHVLSIIYKYAEEFTNQILVACHRYHLRDQHCSFPDIQKVNRR
jgi:hypothetical protein